MRDVCSWHISCLWFSIELDWPPLVLALVAVSIGICRSASIGSSMTIRFNVAMSACERGGQWQRALSLLHDVHEGGVAQHVMSFKVRISACEKGGQWRRALSLLHDNSKIDIAQYVISFNDAISAWEKGRQRQPALS